MTDDPKKLKRDRKRIALTQPHEMQYIRKIAREVLKSKIVSDNLLVYEGIPYSPIKIQRLAKAFLKLSNKYGKKSKKR